MHPLHPFFVLRSPSSMNVQRTSAQLSAVASFYGILFNCSAFDSLVVSLSMVVKGQRLLSQDSTGSNFEGNTAGNNGNNIYNYQGGGN